ncbi:MAG: cob(I)yrinic acid a,c-diamide adenosyltransferase [Candidatus Natronoplasma sp.]
MTNNLDKGLIQVYTGDGKGKTTAAIGLAVRAVGRGLRIYIGQFMKTSDHGEHKALAEFKDKITVEQFGSGNFQFEKDPPQEEIDKAKKGLQKIKKMMTSGNYDIVIADEICVAHHFGLLGLDEILDLIDQRPDNVELVLTGRKAPEKVIEKADLVTEMKEVKHPYRKGISARTGIEK